MGDNSIAIMVVSAFLTYIASVGGTALISGWQNLEISGIFTRSLNTVATTTAATFTGSGGWAAYGANRVVNLGGASDTISWFTAGTGLNNKRLILGASTATHMVTLQNPLDLDTTPCTVQVDDGAAVVDATLSGVLTDWGGLTKTGAGTLQLTAANTYYGDTVISAGMDRLNINGTLDVQANSGNLFTVRLVSMATTTTPGLVPDFNGSTNYTWVIAAASGGILNFDASKFAIDASAFSNAFTGTFSVAEPGNNVVVNYTAAPPPPLIVSSGPLSGTSFPLTFSGPNGQSYQVLTSTDVALPLAGWTMLTTGNFGANPVTYTDTSATNTHQFYRIILP